MLSDLKQHEPALRAAPEAMDMCRELAALRPAAYEADLTRALGVLAHCQKRRGAPS